MSETKKHTQIQRIKILEQIVAQMYMNQKEILKYIMAKQKEEQAAKED